MEDLRAAVRVAGWDAVLDTVAAAHGFAAPHHDHDALAPWRDPSVSVHLGEVHESLLAEEGLRGTTGSFYTPSALVAWVLDHTLPLGGLPSVLDPACGTGNFLVEALRRLGPTAVDRIHGVDLDPVAVAITRLLLRLEAPAVDPRLLERTIRVADGLEPHADGPFDVVVGNPPFLGQLRGRTADHTRAGLGPYTDTSAVFLHHALDLARPGGTVALVQPWSLLAARDAAPVRDAVRERALLTGFWSSTDSVFPGAAVRTCVPVLRVGGGVGVGGVGRPLPEAEWGELVAPSLGIPVVAPRADGVLGDLGQAAADFRDQYYGLAPFVRDGGDGVPLVTSGLIDPARCRWGEVSTRFNKQKHDAPTVDLDALHAEGSLASWATARLVPKVLVATQGRVIEAVVDADGAWLPSVPVVTLAVAPDRLWHALAVLLAPPVVALAAARYAGTALAADAIKLSARQVAALPLPADRDAWDRGAVLARTAQEASDEARPDALAAVAAVMCDAYGDHVAMEWWETRMRSRA